MVSTSGAQLLPEDAIKALQQDLLPLTTLLTPNIPEALLILKTAGQTTKNPTSVDDLIDMGKAVQRLGPRYVLLKGGHLPLAKNSSVSKRHVNSYKIVDILCSEQDTKVYESDYINSKHTHGTGCSLACESIP